MQRWLDAIRPLLRPPALLERRSVLRMRARLLKRSTHVSGNAARKQLLVDVSVIHRHDAGTGIQRVVRAVLSQLLSEPLSDFIVRPVAATRTQPYRYVNWGQARGAQANEGAVAVRPGDVFLGLDLSAHIVPAHRRQLAEWKAQGGALHFVVYDLLPLHHPDWFSGKLVAAFRRWIRSVAVLADGVVCISSTVEADLVAWFELRFGLPRGSVPTRVAPMGWDIAASTPSLGLPAGFEKLVTQLRQGKTALMVGTLEPRKGHAQVLAAFERLWRDDKDYNLVIVGRPGWKTESLQSRLRAHSLHNQRLFWFDGASDETLLKLYDACDGVIIASLAEGFGLPLVEALGHGKPVLARDLPVFREKEQSGIEFFSNHQTEELPGVVANWLERAKRHEIPVADSTALPTWRQTLAALFSSLGAEPCVSDIQALPEKREFRHAT